MFFVNNDFYKPKKISSFADTIIIKYYSIMLKVFLFLSIPIAVGLVYLVKNKFNNNQKKYLQMGLWVFIALFSIPIIQLYI